MLEEKRCAMTEIPRDRMNIDSFYSAAEERVDTVSLATLTGLLILIRSSLIFGVGTSSSNPLVNLMHRSSQLARPKLRLWIRSKDICLRSPTTLSRMVSKDVKVGQPSQISNISSAGVSLSSLAGSKTAVFTGSFADDHKMLSVNDPERLSKYAGSGTSLSILANRLSWWFDLRGPSMNIDTACSSGLVALHLASQSLRDGDSTMASPQSAYICFQLTLPERRLLGAVTSSRQWTSVYASQTWD